MQKISVYMYMYTLSTYVLFLNCSCYEKKTKHCNKLKKKIEEQGDLTCTGRLVLTYTSYVIPIVNMCKLGVNF